MSASTTFGSRLFCIAAIAGAVAPTAAGMRSAFAEEMPVRAEIAAAQEAIASVHSNLPGMGGLGVVPDKDLEPIQALASEAERQLRSAQRQAQSIASIYDEAWAVAHARAAQAFARTADELRRKQGY